MTEVYTLIGLEQEIPFIESSNIPASVVAFAEEAGRYVPQGTRVLAVTGSTKKAGKLYHDLNIPVIHLHKSYDPETFWTISYQDSPIAITRRGLPLPRNSSFAWRQAGLKKINIGILISNLDLHNSRYLLSSDVTAFLPSRRGYVRVLDSTMDPSERVGVLQNYLDRSGVLIGCESLINLSHPSPKPGHELTLSCITFYQIHNGPMILEEMREGKYPLGLDIRDHISYGSLQLASAFFYVASGDELKTWEINIQSGNSGRVLDTVEGIGGVLQDSLRALLNEEIFIPIDLTFSFSWEDEPDRTIVRLPLRRYNLLYSIGSYLYEILCNREGVDQKDLNILLHHSPQKPVSPSGFPNHRATLRETESGGIEVVFILPNLEDTETMLERMTFPSLKELLDIAERYKISLICN